jgi:7,8-dihydropterin-6-yl-methyl-4-(beta-D-ribofuranosyl)aminobenzene 5'-phosphate synthase
MLSSALGEVTMKRREFLKLGAVASGVFALGSVTIGGRNVAAQSGGIPTVDRLVLTNVVDNVYDIFAKGGKLDTVTVQRAAFARSGDTLLSEHGLAYHLESLRSSERREVLLDFALTELNLSNNYRALKIDPARADALILSHGHVDHYGALAPLVEKGVIRRGLTLYAGGEDTFCRRVVKTPAGDADMGQLDQPALEARGLKVVLAKQPAVVAGHALTTGQIDRLTDFEKPPAAGRLVVGPVDSACAVSHFGVTQVAAKPGELVFDNFQGEHATVYTVKDRGLVVITSCGHAGVINSVRQAQKVTGVQKVHAIVGGFHLAPAPDAVVEKTVQAFKEINPDYVIPEHCTGLNTIMAVHREMPGKLVMPSTGTRVIFGA